MIKDQVACWNATINRDATADGRFVYAVVTTGIYCRPSCPTPTPHQRNVRFFADSAAAEAAGFHACKRCRPALASPLAWQIAAVGKACDILHRSEHAPCLGALAVAVGVSRFHFHRIFRTMLGVTPGEYASAARSQRLVASLEAGRPVAEAIYDAGYGSISRAYTEARQVLGTMPAAWRAGGAGLAVRFAIVERAAGHVLVATTGEDVCVIEFGGDPAALVTKLRRHLPAAVLERHAADATALLAGAVRRAPSCRRGRSSSSPRCVTWPSARASGRRRGSIWPPGCRSSRRARRELGPADGFVPYAMRPGLMDGARYDREGRCAAFRVVTSRRSARERA